MKHCCCCCGSRPLFTVASLEGRMCCGVGGRAELGPETPSGGVGWLGWWNAGGLGKRFSLSGLTGFRFVLGETVAPSLLVSCLARLDSLVGPLPELLFWPFILLKK